MVVGRVYELLEFNIGNWILVDVERVQVHWMLVEPPRRVLPRILNVYPHVIEAFNFDSRHAEMEIRCGNPDHSCWSGTRPFGRLNGDDLLGQNFPFMRIAGERSSAESLHPGHQRSDLL